MVGHIVLAGASCAVYTTGSLHLSEASRADGSWTTVISSVAVALDPSSTGLPGSSGGLAIAATSSQNSLTRDCSIDCIGGSGSAFIEPATAELHSPWVLGDRGDAGAKAEDEPPGDASVAELVAVLRMLRPLKFPLCCAALDLGDIDELLLDAVGLAGAKFTPPSRTWPMTMFRLPALFLLQAWIRPRRLLKDSASSDLRNVRVRKVALSRSVARSLASGARAQRFQVATSAFSRRSNRTSNRSCRMRLLRITWHLSSVEIWQLRLVTFRRVRNRPKEYMIVGYPGGGMMRGSGRTISFEHLVLSVILDHSDEERWLFELGNQHLLSLLIDVNQHHV